MNSSFVNRSFLLIVIVGFVVVSSSTAQSSPPPLPPLNLTIKDLTPKFLQFYDEATKENASAERRWELWKKDYDFAAVPPTPEGEQMARKILDDAWPKYPGVLDRIRGGATSITPDPHVTLGKIAELLRPQRPVNITLLVYVGGLEGNAFTAAQDGKITTALPIEDDLATRALRMTHELTHAVHISMGSFSGGWIRTIGTTVLTEGLAMRVTQQLLPGHPESYYVEARSGWFEEAAKLRNAILKDVRKAVESDKSEDVMRFTMGKGPSGIEREAYYAGWVVVGYWIEHGMTFTEIARITEKEMPRRVGETIDTLLAAK
ncbi:MAG: hypothetical protein Udaeo2_27880 [Candidatus Udaeobacter sp.]|jgi:hypothetical protein|nr:MAG: hypothetical protein Udaeo2_27880 [Candidatus Udaeobacter sp.]